MSLMRTNPRKKVEEKKGTLRGLAKREGREEKTPLEGRMFALRPRGAAPFWGITKLVDKSHWCL
jgi:hypothetical protein